MQILDEWPHKNITFTRNEKLQGTNALCVCPYVCKYAFVLRSLLFPSRGGRAWGLQIKLPQILHPSKLIKNIWKAFISFL